MTSMFTFNVWLLLYTTMQIDSLEVIGFPNFSSKMFALQNEI